MATVSFRLRGKNEVKRIYVRYSLSTSKRFLSKTPLTWKQTKTNWKNGLPKGSDALPKQVRNKLFALSDLIEKNYNLAITNNEIITNEPLVKSIKQHFNLESTNSDLNIVVNYIDKFINDASIKENKTNGLGLAKNTLRSYVSLKNILIKYQGKNNPLLIKDVNIKFRDSFVKWCIDKQKYNPNSINKFIANIKAICNDAILNEIETSPFLSKIKGVPTTAQDVIYLTLDDIDKIRNTTLDKNYLINVRKWILIGCNTGQRGSDLLKITISNFTKDDKDRDAIRLTQKKGGTEVLIIASSDIKKMLKTGLPHEISQQKLNKYIKEICKIANINTPTIGNKLNKETKRKETQTLPKHEFITSHTFRRTFVTNAYGILDNEIIRSVTGHSNDKIMEIYLNAEKNRKSSLDKQAKYFDMQDNIGNSSNLKVI